MVRKFMYSSIIFLSLGCAHTSKTTTAQNTAAAVARTPASTPSVCNFRTVPHVEPDQLYAIDHITETPVGRCQNLDIVATDGDCLNLVENQIENGANFRCFQIGSTKTQARDGGSTDIDGSGKICFACQ